MKAIVVPQPLFVFGSDTSVINNTRARVLYGPANKRGGRSIAGYIFEELVGTLEAELEAAMSVRRTRTDQAQQPDIGGDIPGGGAI